jgi:hypothetical protein
MGKDRWAGSRTLALNDSYTLFEEARKVPQAAAFGSIHSLSKVLCTLLRKYLVRLLYQVRDDKGEWLFLTLLPFSSIILQRRIRSEDEYFGDHWHCK